MINIVFGNFCTFVTYLAPGPCAELLGGFEWTFLNFMQYIFLFFFSISGFTTISTQTKNFPRTDDPLHGGLEPTLNATVSYQSNSDWECFQTLSGINFSKNRNNSLGTFFVVLHNNKNLFLQFIGPGRVIFIDFSMLITFFGVLPEP